MNPDLLPGPEHIWALAVITTVFYGGLAGYFVLGLGHIVWSWLRSQPRDPS